MNKPDIVYLWVDGNDPIWQANREKALNRYLLDRSETEIKNEGKYARVAGRWRDNDELRYSLRSLMPYLNYFGTIYVITDNQIPKWFNGNSGLKIINSHSLLKNNESYPTFSSKNLETKLNRIKGLSDTYLYFNDDVFLGGHFMMEDFFCKNKTTVIFDKTIDYKKINKEAAHVIAEEKSKSILSTLKNYTHIDDLLAHAPHPIIKSQYQTFQNTFSEIFNKARQEIFRNNMIPVLLSDTYPRWLLHNKMAIIKQAEHRLIDSGDVKLHNHLMELKKNFNNVSFFCINDTLDNATNDDVRLKKVKDMLELLFPVPSNFEK